MSLANLRDALANIYAVFREPAIIDGREDITIDLSLDAGMRFDSWLHANLPADLYPDPKFIQQHARADLPTAWRHVTIDGVRIRWPVKVDGGKPWAPIR